MKNKIVASVEFYFKGELYSPKTTIDLDRLMMNQKNGLDILASIHPMLAKENGIDLYSYEFEIMLEETILFSEATGIATDYLRDGQFFIEDFKKAWQEEKVLEYIQPIAKQYLGIDNLSQHDDLKAALTEAYVLGKSQSKFSGN